MSDLDSVTSLGTPTGTGNLVRDTSPTLITPVLVAATATSVSVPSQALASGTMTYSVIALESGLLLHRFDWTNAMIVALGAALTGDITIGTLAAKTAVRRIWTIVTGQAAGPTTLTMSVGYTAATYIDYLIATSLKVAANTLIGGVAGDLGAKMLGYDIPSVTATTALKAHLIATIANLDQTTGSAGSIYIETLTLP